MSNQLEWKDRMVRDNPRLYPDGVWRPNAMALKAKKGRPAAAGVTELTQAPAVRPNPPRSTAVSQALARTDQVFASKIPHRGREQGAARDDGSDVVALARQCGLKGFSRSASQSVPKQPPPKEDLSNDPDGAAIVAFARQMGLRGFSEPRRGGDGRQ